MRKTVLLVGLLFALLSLLSFLPRNVFAPGDVTITMNSIDNTMQGPDCQATFKITVTYSDPSTTRYVWLTLEDPIHLSPISQFDSPPSAAIPLPSGWTYSLSLSEFYVGHGYSQSVESTLTITGTAGTPPGSYPFRVIGYWLDQVRIHPPLDTYRWKDFAGCVSVKTQLVVPEYWLGTILGLVGMFAAFGTYRFSKRKQFNL